MPATRPRVPGWHPDPEDPSFLRHWDGRRWGRERRPRPSWVPLTPDLVVPLASAPGGPQPEPPPTAPPGRAPRRRWWLLAGGAVVFGLVLVLVPAWLDTAPNIPPRSVGDVGFTDRAEALCAEALPPLRAARPESREDTGTATEFARRIDRAADGLEDVVRDLRAVPVAAADAAEVDRWLDDWDAYVAVGRRYADRIRAEEGSATEEIGDEGSRISTSIFVFARSNGMPSCAL